MDLRAPVLAILVGGSPAPGINGVVCAATLEAIKCGWDVIGFMEGYKRLREGKSKVMTFTSKDVMKLQNEGGSVLRTSKMQPTTPQEVDNVLRVLEQHRVRYLVTIGGVITAQSSTMVAEAAKKAKIKLSIVHVPKTIFNDIPLPGASRTFGFNTARAVGHDLVTMFAADAATMVRWYILTCVGVQSGHLTLGIGKSAAANLTLIPEQYRDRKQKLTFSELVDTIEATIYKRRVEDQNYGIAMLCEGLVECLDHKEMQTLFGNVDDGHQDIGRAVAAELSKRFKKAGGGLELITVVARNIGTECRAARPSAEDILLSRDLGYGAVRYLVEGGSGAMVSLRGSKIQPIPLTELVDEKTGVTAVRLVNTKGIHYQVAHNYMTRVKASDLVPGPTLLKLATAAHTSSDAFAARFAYLADDDTKAVAKEDSIIADIGLATSSNRGWVSPPTSNPLMRLPASTHSDAKTPTILSAVSSATAATGMALAAKAHAEASVNASAAAFSAAAAAASKPMVSTPPNQSPKSLSPAAATRKLDAAPKAK